MALTASFTSYPETTVSNDFHVIVEFSQAIDPTTLVGTDLRIRRSTGQFNNPGNDDVDFYTDDNITFLIVLHTSDFIINTGTYLVRMPMNRIEYQDENDVTQNGPDATINTPEFGINISFSITPTITYPVSEGEVGTAVTATVTFLQPVSGVDISDFSVVDGTLGDLTVVDTDEYQVEVTPTTGDGTLTLTFAEDGTYEGNAEGSADLTYTGPVALTTPSAPRNLTATAQSNGTSVVLDWDVPSDDGGASVSDYEYSSNGGSTFTAIGSTDTDYTVTGLDKNTEYDFQVRAVNSEGAGTATATVTTTTSITTATAPQNLAVTVPTNGTSLAATWDAPIDDGGELTDYEYSTDDGSSWNSTGSTNTSYTITGLAKNTEYDVKIRAVNSEGNGTASATVTETTASTTPSAPTGLSVTVGDTTADLSWTAPSDTGGVPISSYEVSSDDGGTWTDTGDADLSYQITGLTAETEYDFKVRAVNSEGSGIASTTVTETTAVTPTLTWEVPAQTVGNIFSATLTSNVPLDAAPTVDDLRLRDDDNSDPIITLNSSNTTITAIAGTDNYLIELDLTGTYDDDYTIRINGNTVEYNSINILSTQLASSVFAIQTLSFDGETIANQSWTVGTTITSLTLPEATGGDTTKTYSLSPTLPAGIDFAAATRILSGNPTAVFSSATFTYTVTDGAGSTADLTFTIVVAAAPILLGFGNSAIAAQAWVVGTAVSLTLPAATGGNDTKTYSLSTGLPDGITFVAGTRILSGTPTGRFTSATFTYTVTDGDSDTAELTFTIVVTATFSFDSTIDDQIWTVDEAESLTLPGATGGVGTLMYALTGILPTGMTHSNFDVSGTPTEESVLMSFTWTVTDGESVAIQQTFTIVVNVSTVEADRLEAQRIRRQASILPPNATILQVDILHTAIEMLNLHTHETFNGQEEIPIRHLWNPDLCPENALPNLARALSIEIDITQFGVDTQRELIKNSFTIHRQKGTIASIRSALETFNITLASDWLVEGRRDSSNNIIRENGGWAQFSINIESSIPTSLAQESALQVS